VTETGTKLDQAWFRKVLGHFPTGVVIVTAMSGDAPTGLAIGSFLSVSLEPRLVAVLPAKTSTSWPRIAAADSFCVNVLHVEQQDLCRRFAVSGGDKFAGVRWRPAPSGAPILDGALAWIDCDHERSVDAGDHLMVLGRVRSLEVDAGQVPAPLIFFQGRYGTFAGGAEL